MKTLVWEGCYDDQWKGVIPDSAFEHPAKFSKRLVERIIEHMEDRGWLEKGETIADPFAGVRLGGVIAAYRGYQWIGQELEERFMQLGDQVFARHRGRWDSLGVPQPICIKGDSRRFDETLRGVSAVVSSPPYVSGGHHTDVFDAWNNNGGGQNSQPSGYGKTDGQIAQLKEGEVAAVITSPVYSGNDKCDYSKQKRRKLKDKCTFGGSETYGKSAGQIGTLKQGEVDAVVASPPFLRAHGGEKGIMVTGYTGKDGRVDKGISKRQYRDGARSPENIEDLPAGGVDAVVASPPWAGNTEGTFKGSKFSSPEKALKAKRGHGCSDKARLAQLKRDEASQIPTSEGQIAAAPLGNVAAVISSPPYETIATGAGGLNTSPPRKSGQQSGRRANSPSQSADQRYGDSEGQIARLKKGNVDIVIEARYNEGHDDQLGMDRRILRGRRVCNVVRRGKSVSRSGSGDNDRSERIEATGNDSRVSREGRIPRSPVVLEEAIPKQMEGADQRLMGVTNKPQSRKSVVPPDGNSLFDSETCEGRRSLTQNPQTAEGHFISERHCDDSSPVGQRGTESQNKQSDRSGSKASASRSPKQRETYWEAVSQVYSACYRSLKPGGVMCLVLKDFVKNKKRQRLCDDTLKLLKHLGFEPLERVRAMLVKHYVIPDLFEGTTIRTKTRKSFFRRHLESKLAADDPRRIDWEEILFVRKPI